MAVKELHVNGATQRIDADPDRTLLSVLRDDLGLTGAKYGCGEGKCGACTVHLDGKSARSCRTSVEKAAAKKIRTIEGISDGDRLHAVQEAFLSCDALQCGYCTPGMIMSAISFLADHPQPTREQIIRGMNGNICRCGAYPRILWAIELAAKKLQGVGK